MNKKKVDSILKAATMAGVALGASAIVDADVVYAVELSESNTSSSDSELDNTQSATESISQSESEGNTSPNNAKLGTAESSSVYATIAPTNSGAEILQTIENIVGNYGVVAEKVTINSDIETNIKADKLTTNSHTVGSSSKYSDNSSEVIYIGDFADGEYVQANHSMPTEVVIGLAANEKAQIIDGPNAGYKKVIVTVKNEEGTETTKTIIINNNGENVSTKKETTTVSDELKEVATQAEALKKLTNENNSVSIVDAKGGSGTKTVAASENTSDTVYVNISNQSSLFNGNDPAHNQIVLNKNQTVVFNITPNGNTFTLDGYVINVNGGAIAGENQADTPKYADKIVFNFGDFAGTVNGGGRGIAANIIAPNAIVNTYHTSTGQVIAKEFNAASGEWHYNGRYDGSDSASESSGSTSTSTSTSEGSASTSTSTSEGSTSTSTSTSEGSTSTSTSTSEGSTSTSTSTSEGSTSTSTSTSEGSTSTSTSTSEGSTSTSTSESEGSASTSTSESEGSTSTSTSESTNESTSESTISSTSEIPDEDVPLTELPDEDIPLEELPDEDVPLAVVDPDEDDPLVILDEDVPLAGSNPETGDSTTLTWVGTAAAAVTGLLGAGKGKKKKDDTKK